MSLFRDIFDAFHGRMPKRVKDQHIMQVWPHPEIDAGIKAAQAREQRQSRRGKQWEYIGDRLHLEGFPITIRRATADEVQIKPGIFCVECDTLIPVFVWDMEDAKFVGERWAREIDALPLTPKQEESPSAGCGMKFQKCSVIKVISIQTHGLVTADTKVLQRIKDAGLTPEEAVEQGMATVEFSTFRLNGGVPLPGEASSEKTEG